MSDKDNWHFDMLLGNAVACAQLEERKRIVDWLRNQSALLIGNDIPLLDPSQTETAEFVADITEQYADAIEKGAHHDTTPA